MVLRETMCSATSSQDRVRSLLEGHSLRLLLLFSPNLKKYTLGVTPRDSAEGLEVRPCSLRFQVKVGKDRCVP